MIAAIMLIICMFDNIYYIILYTLYMYILYMLHCYLEVLAFEMANFPYKNFYNFLIIERFETIRKPYYLYIN